MKRSLEKSNNKQVEESLLVLKNSEVLVEEIPYAKANKAPAAYLVIQNDLYDENGNKLPQSVIFEKAMGYNTSYRNIEIEE